MTSEVDIEVAVINAVYSRTSDITELESKNALINEHSNMATSITLVSNKISTFGNADLSDKTLSDDGTGNKSYLIQIHCHNHSTLELIELNESLSIWIITLTVTSLLSPQEREKKSTTSI